MKIFSPTESAHPKGSEVKSVKKSGKAKKHVAPPQKAEISERAIREKLASHVETSNSAKSKVMEKNSQALGAGFLSDAKAPGDKVEAPKKEDSIKDSHLLMSDVKLNDPNDPNTQEKLKSVLTKGAFNFNAREREALEKILGN